MKKSLRIASILLALVLVTSCFVGGTFAKYITKDDAADSARVAKFGVEVKADGSLFENAYIDAPETDEDVATVVASDSTNVVAPGTKNADEAFTFSITGKPEVDVQVDVVVTEADEDVFLKAGTYENLTTGDQDDTTVLAQDYYPVKYTLTNKTSDTVVVNGGTLADLKAGLEGLTKTVQANQDLVADAGYGEYEITWAWAFGDDNKEVTGNDEYDTILGDLAAGTPAAGLNGAALTAGMENDYNLGTGLKVAITVTQID